MPYILTIDTAVQTASVCIAEPDRTLGLLTNPSQKDHAAWLHQAISSLMAQTGLSFPQLSAVVISAGPGSYTGLRVGMAAAKGLCYVHHIPLITVNTLQMMAAAALQEPTDLLCPMIDARRVEVFTALFDKNLNEIFPSTNLILDENVFRDVLQHHTITCFGNGSAKFQPIISNQHVFFKSIPVSAENLTGIGFQRLDAQKFADLAYVEPFYGKEFFTHSSKHSL